MIDDKTLKEAKNQPPTTQLEPLEVTCIECGNTFTMSPAEQKFYLIRNYNLPKRCRPCREAKTTLTTYICKDCGKEFTLNNQEIAFYTKQGLQLPKRCNQCREIKRERTKMLQAQEDNK